MKEMNCRNKKIYLKKNVSFFIDLYDIYLFPYHARRGIQHTSTRKCDYSLWYFSSKKKRDFFS